MKQYSFEYDLDCFVTRLIFTPFWRQMIIDNCILLFFIGDLDILQFAADDIKLESYNFGVRHTVQFERHQVVIFFPLTHCGPVMPYGIKDLGQHWFM